MNVLHETITMRMNDPGLEFMAAGRESYLEDQSYRENTLSQAIADLLELEYILRRESYQESPETVRDALGENR